MEEFTERNSSTSALKGSGHNRTKGIVGRGERQQTPTDCKSRMETDLDIQWVWGGMIGRKGYN